MSGRQTERGTLPLGGTAVHVRTRERSGQTALAWLYVLPLGRRGRYTHTAPIRAECGPLNDGVAWSRGHLQPVAPGRGRSALPLTCGTLWRGCVPR